MFDDIIAGSEKIHVHVPKAAFVLRDMLLPENTHILLCGGFVRDAVLGVKPYDLDLFCDGYGLFSAIIKNKIAWKRHVARNVVLIKIGKLYREVSFPNFTFSLEEDALNRDMNYNVLYSNLEGNIIDPLNVYQEIKTRQPVRLLSEDVLEKDDNRTLRFLLLHFKLHPQNPCGEESLNWCRLHPPLWNHPRYKNTLLRILSLPDPFPAITVAWDNGMLQCFTQQDIIRMNRAWQNGERRASKLIKILSVRLGDNFCI